MLKNDRGYIAAVFFFEFISCFFVPFYYFCVKRLITAALRVCAAVKQIKAKSVFAGTVRRFYRNAVGPSAVYSLCLFADAVRQGFVNVFELVFV